MIVLYFYCMFVLLWKILNFDPYPNVRSKALWAYTLKQVKGGRLHLEYEPIWNRDLTNYQQCTYICCRIKYWQCTVFLSRNIYLSYLWALHLMTNFMFLECFQSCIQCFFSDRKFQIQLQCWIMLSEDKDKWPILKTSQRWKSYQSSKFLLVYLS